MPISKIPHNAEAEQAVLASILLEPRTLFEIDLTPRDFFLETNARIFEIMREISNAGDAPDIVSVAAKSKDSARALPYLTGLIASIPSPSLIRQYAEQVRRERIKRDLLNASTHVAEIAANSHDLETSELVPEAFRRLNKIELPERGVIVPIADAIAEYTPTFDALIESEREVVGIPTGLDIDKYIGGLIGGDLSIIAGEPGKGKTSIGMQTAFEVARNGHRTIVFSLEMARRQYMLRLYATLGNVNAEDIKRGKVKRHSAEYGRIMQGVDAIARSPLYVVDTSQSTESIRGHLAWLQQRGEPVEFVVIDYLDMLTDHAEGNEEKRVGRLARAAKRIARDYDCCVWLLHAVNRKDEISLRSLKYGGDYDADEVIICHFEDNRQDNAAQLHIVKNRNGATCIVPMIYRGEVTRWDNPARIEARRPIVTPPPTWDNLPMPPKKEHA